MKVIIFDMDGVLAQTSDIHEEAFLEVLKPLGLDQFFHYEAYSGMSTIEVLKSFFQTQSSNKNESELTSLAKKKSDIAFSKMQQSRYMTEGTPEILESLNKRFVLALASSGSKRSVDHFVKFHKLDKYFSQVLNSSDVQQAKPNPEIFLKTAKLLGVSPKDCLVVEDSCSGVEAATSANMKTIGFSIKASQRKLLTSQNLASCVLDDLHMLIPEVAN